MIAHLSERLRERLSSLPARITAIAMLPVLLLALMVGGLSISLRKSDLAEGLQQRGLLLARLLSSAADYGVFSGNRAALQTLAESVAREQAVAGVQILDRDNQVLATAGTAPPPGEPERAWRVFQEPIRSPQLAVDDVDAPARAPGGAPQGSERVNGLAIIYLTTAQIDEEERRFTAIVIGILAAVLLATGLVARRMSRRVSRPVVEVAQAVERIGRGDTSVRVQPSTIGVLDLLGKGVNEMAQQLERAMHELEQRVLDATRQLVDKKDEAERANNAKSRFLAAASHDLRQPMHALGMFVAALAQQPATAMQRKLISQIDRAVVAMGELLDSLLDISRLDAGVIRKNVGAFPVQTVFDRVRNEFTAAAQAKGLDLFVRRTPYWVSSDRILLERVIVNLVSNAIRYTDSGRIVVAARLCGPGLEQVRIDVRDSGPGIPDEAREAIFQEFVQLANPERDRSKGLGLGLAIVKRLVALLDHALVLRTAPGRGAMFSVRMPRVWPTEAQAREAALARLEPARGPAAAAPRAAVRPDTVPAAPLTTHTVETADAAEPMAPVAPGALAPTAPMAPMAPLAPMAPGAAAPSDRPDPRQARRDPAHRGPPPGSAGARPVVRERPTIDRPFAGVRVLVIDDDAMVRESLSGLLRSWGAGVAATAGDMNLPAALARAPRPDVVLCDLRLADNLDGVTLLGAIRETLGGHLPAVLITGDTAADRLQLASGSGDPVMHKPVRPAQLRGMLRSILSSRSG